MSFNQNEFIGISPCYSRKNTHTKNISLLAYKNPTVYKHESLSTLPSRILSNKVFCPDTKIKDSISKATSDSKLAFQNKSSIRDLKQTSKRDLSPEEEDKIDKIIKTKLTLKFNKIKSSIYSKLINKHQSILSKEINLLRTDSLSAVKLKNMYGLYREKKILPEIKKEALNEVMLGRKVINLKSKRDLALEEMENTIVKKTSFIPSKLSSENLSNSVNKIYEEAVNNFKVHTLKSLIN